MIFENRTVLITGAAVGIGRACALQFAKNGANIILVDYNSETLENIEKEVKEITDSCLSFVCDVADNDSVLNVVKKATDCFGKIDILVNNAGIWRKYIPFNKMDIGTWKEFIDVNIMGTVYFTKAVIDGMIENNYGKIINLASVAGVYGNANMAAYSATKGAVISFTKALAKEVADKGINVNSVSPGTVSPAEQKDLDYVESNELSYSGRSGSTRENADLVCFLASDNAAYINGQNIQIDGCRKNI